MGTGILTFYQNKIKKTWKLSFYSAFLIGLAVHFYKFVNLLPNLDSLYNFYSSQNMAASGRWFLSVSCALSSYFDLPWLIGLLSLLFMGVTSAVITEIFQMEDPVLIVLSSALQVSFPAITGTMTFEFTADGYMLAMALAAFSVSLTRLEYVERKYWKNWVLAGICICLSCAIYQAYVSFAFILAVCYFMGEILGNFGGGGYTPGKQYKNVENKTDYKFLWKWIGAQCLTYVGAMILYYGIWQIVLRMGGFSAVTYQGIDEVGKMNGATLITAVKTIVSHFVRFFLEWNILQYGVTPYSVLNILFLITLAVGLFLAAKKTGCLKQKGRLLLLLLCCVSIPFGCYIWHFASPKVYYLARMLQSICVLYVFAAVLYDRYFRPGISNLVLILLVAIVFNNTIAANIYYNYMHQSFEKTQTVAAEVSTRVHMLDDGTIKYVAFCGKLDDWEQEDYFTPEGLRLLGGWKSSNKMILTPQFMALYAELDLSYYRSNGIEYPVVENEPGIPAPQNWEFRFPVLSAAEQTALAQTKEVKEMPIWPARDSVQVIGETVVVKLSDIDAS